MGSEMCIRDRAICIKGKFGQSYKDIPDEKIQDIIDYIDYLVENPN